MQQGKPVGSSRALVTADEFARITDDRYRHELVEGRVISMSLPGSRHGVVGTRLAALLWQFVDAHDLGVVITNGGFKLAADPDTVRGPDIAFVCGARVPEAGVPDGFWPAAPDLAIEVRSPGDRLPRFATRCVTISAMACGWCG
jgi:Uma2 family endonuclease